MTNPSLKKISWKNPNKADIQTGHKAFNRYCNFLGTGNVCADGMISGFIRPRTETECNEHTFPEGALQDFDLSPFRKNFRIPEGIIRRIKAETEPAILYAFFHYVGEKQVFHGLILTRTGEKNYDLIWSEKTGPTEKSQAVLDWCRDYVSTY